MWHKRSRVSDRRAGARLTDKSREELARTLVAAGATVVVSIATRKALDAGWRKARHEEPPDNPGASDVDWPQALAWTTVISLAVGLARLFARRGAQAGWRRATGRLPPSVRPGRFS